MFKLMSKTDAHEIGSVCYLYEHESGAQLMHIKNSDSNKVFSVSFKTPPYDDTGVFHILEHCVLNGSKKYNCKDPFNELSKGSLNTYLNAMTYGDKTMYPIASYNQKDFMNLMKVYLDAVYAPLILERKEIFLQEGFRHVMNAEKVGNNGIVYNEMKGSFSNPSYLIHDYVSRLLFPEACYKYSAGGHPLHIPEITYEALLEAYNTYYVPSNSYIYLYGDLDIEECMKEIEVYLDKAPVQSPEIELQRMFEAAINSETKYQLAKSETLEGKDYLVAGYVIGAAKDTKLSESIQMLNYILFQNQASPLKNALKHMGDEISGQFSSDILQPIYKIIVKNSSNSIDEFKTIINEKLVELVENGIDKKLIESAVNKFEFYYREEDYGYWPKGLAYNVAVMPNWMHGGEPFEALSKLKIIDEIKNKENYFENLIKEYFLNNNHCCYVTSKAGYEPVYDEYEFKNPSKESIEAINNDNKILTEYQKTDDTKEQLSKIPHISVSDIKKESEPDNIDIDENILITNIAANDVIYVEFLFNTQSVSEEQLGYIRLLCHCLGKLDTKSYKYGDLANEIDINMGGYGFLFTAEPLPRLSLKIKVLKSKIEKAKNLMLEVIQNTLLEDKERLLFLLKELKSYIDRAMLTEGHSFAIRRAKSYFQDSGNYTEKVYGVDFYFFLKDILKDYDNNFETIKSNMYSIMKAIFSADNLFIAATENYCLSDFTGRLEKIGTTGKSIHRAGSHNMEAFITPSQVQYAVKAADYRKYAAYSGEMAVLGVVLSGGHLLTEIRVKGGAYGCGCVLQREGTIFMYSYRDPEIRNTLRVFDGAANSLANVAKEDLEKYIIGAINTIDRPLTPRGEHDRAVYRYMRGITYNDMQKERDEILGISTESLRRYSEMLEMSMAENNICVFGSDTKIQENKDIFQKIYIL